MVKQEAFDQIPYFFYQSLVDRFLAALSRLQAVLVTPLPAFTWLQRTNHRMVFAGVLVSRIVAANNMAAKMRPAVAHRQACFAACGLG
jgi:hypothetical protein